MQVENSSNLNKIKHFFGMFNLSPFEEYIINFLRERLPPDWKKILDSQFSKFNKVDRVINNTEVNYGHTSFYWVKWGKARFDFPLKFPSKKKQDVLASMTIYSIDDKNTIDIKFVLVEGFLFSIEYRSKSKKHIPVGSFEITDFRIDLEG